MVRSFLFLHPQTALGNNAGSFNLLLLVFSYLGMLWSLLACSLSFLVFLDALLNDFGLLIIFSRAARTLS